MSDTTHGAMLNRRPGLRPFIITRSTFAGAGKKVGKWLGDNLSSWEQYRWSIPGMLGFASLYQIPMVGSDTCGFGLNATETLCARWATLGAFNPFYRNHNQDDSAPQEFYRWPLVAQAARNAIATRYRLLDYIYTALHTQHTTGAPLLNPLFFRWPRDTNVFSIDSQFLYGPALLVSPVTAQNSTSVLAYLPDEQLYEFTSGRPVRGRGAAVTLAHVEYDQIPLHIVGGAILPLRLFSDTPMTTTALRAMPFEIVVAPDRNGEASGRLYLDDGVSVLQTGTVEMAFTYAKGRLRVSVKVTGTGTALDVGVARVRLLGAAGKGDVKGERSSVVDGARVVEVARSLLVDWDMEFDV